MLLVVYTFQSVDKILKCAHSSESQRELLQCLFFNDLQNVNLNFFLILNLVKGPFNQIRSSFGNRTLYEENSKRLHVFTPCEQSLQCLLIPMINKLQMHTIYGKRITNQLLYTFLKQLTEFFLSRQTFKSINL